MEINREGLGIGKKDWQILNFLEPHLSPVKIQGVKQGQLFLIPQGIGLPPKRHQKTDTSMLESFSVLLGTFSREVKAKKKKKEKSSNQVSISTTNLANFQPQSYVNILLNILSVSARTNSKQRPGNW